MNEQRKPRVHNARTPGPSRCTHAAHIVFLTLLPSGMGFLMVPRDDATLLGNSLQLHLPSFSSYCIVSSSSFLPFFFSQPSLLRPYSLCLHLASHLRLSARLFSFSTASILFPPLPCLSQHYPLSLSICLCLSLALSPLSLLSRPLRFSLLNSSCIILHLGFSCLMMAYHPTSSGLHTFRGLVAIALATS